MSSNVNYPRQFYQGAKTGNVEAMKEAVKNVIEGGNNLDNVIDNNVIDNNVIDNNVIDNNLINLSLIESASNGHLEAAQYLLESNDLPVKADIHSQDDRAFTWACQNQHWEVANYLKDQGANIATDNHYVYRMMVENKIERDNSIVMATFEQLKQDIKQMDEKNKSFFIHFSKQQKDIALEEFIENLAIENFIENLTLEGFQNKKAQNETFDKSYLLQAISNKNYRLIKQYVEHYNIDESVIDKILEEKDVEAFLIVKDKVQLSDKNKWFLKALEKNHRIALEIVNLYGEFFENSTHYSFYDNYDNEDNDSHNAFFPQVALLPRRYSGIQYNNNKETFAAMLLDRAMDCYVIDDQLLVVFDYIIENRKEYNIKDEDIVQYFIERNYEIGWAFTGVPKIYNGKKDKLVHILDKLTQEGVSFASDKAGYIVQIIAYHKVNNLKSVLVNAIQNGSHAQGFFKRFNEKSNWLEIEQEQLFNQTDDYNERRYDVYKKFDSHNTIEENIIKEINRTEQYVSLNNMLPNKQLCANTKTKL